MDNVAGRADNRAMRFVLLAPSALIVALGCSAASGPSGFTGGAGGEGATGTSITTTSSDTGNLGGGIHFGGAGGGTGGSVVGEVAEVFAHSAFELYKLDPVSKAVTTVGTFQGCDFSSVIDIAINKDGAMYATTFGGLFKVDKTTAVCTPIATGDYPNSLSFVPQGTVDPSVEALVGYQGSTYVRIDLANGAVTPIGVINGGYTSSGDIVSVIGGGTYLTVVGNGCGDCIVEVDPKTGDMKKMIGQLGHSAVYGLAFWGGSAYGFSTFGELFQINLTNGVSTVIPMPSAPPGLSFYGAGSTTSAPLKPPQ